MIQNYDTNGLIFVLDPEHEKIQSTIDSEEYKKAVLNVMNSQADGFFCIPIISAPRVRANRNDAITRAVYNNSDGAITYIARRGVFEDEDNIVLIPNSEIVHIQGTTSLLEALKLIFTPNSNGKYNFVLTVDGTKQQPIALFSPDQIIQKYCKKEIRSRLFDICDQERTKLILGLAEKISNRQLVSLEEIEQIKIDEISLLKDTIDKTESRITNIKTRNAEDDLEAKDIMTWGAQAITISDTLPNEMSVKIVCLANNFSNLIVRTAQGELIPEIVSLDQKSQKIDRRRSKEIKPNEKLEVILTNFRALKQSSAALIVEVDENILSGEGQMQWPGIIAIEDIMCPEVFNKMAGLFTNYETNLRMLIRDITDEEELPLIRPDKEIRPKEIMKMNLGDLWYLLDMKQHNSLLNVVSEIVQKGKSRFLNDHDNIRELHNELKHCLLSLNVIGSKITEISSIELHVMLEMMERGVNDCVIDYTDELLQIVKQKYSDLMRESKSSPTKNKSFNKKNNGKKSKINKNHRNKRRSPKSGKKLSRQERISELRKKLKQLTEEYGNIPPGMGANQKKRMENFATRQLIKEKLESLEG